jgi:hypothetical protein
MLHERLGSRSRRRQAEASAEMSTIRMLGFEDVSVDSAS